MTTIANQLTIGEGIFDSLVPTQCTDELFADLRSACPNNILGEVDTYFTSYALSTNLCLGINQLCSSNLVDEYAQHLTVLGRLI